MREDATHVVLQKISCDSNLKNSRHVEFLLFAFSQFALGQFLEYFVRSRNNLPFFNKAGNLRVSPSTFPGAEVQRAL